MSAIVCSSRGTGCSRPFRAAALAARADFGDVVGKIASLPGAPAALGLDYDVFLLTRIYEERTNGMGDRASIVRGLVHSGNIITAAGCIMAIAFTGLLINATPALNQLAAALVASVLLDTFVVRTLLLPSVMGLLGSWNWWPRRMPPVALGVDWATRASVAEGDAGAAPAPADAPRPINDA